VISEFYGKVRACIKHKDAAFVLEEAYSQFANAKQRTALMEEFYGPEFALFKVLNLVFFFLLDSEKIQNLHIAKIIYFILFSPLNLQKLFIFSFHFLN
jgi:hypothetical protein